MQWQFIYLLVECNMADNYFKRGKRDKAMKLCQQVMEKLNDMEEHDQITGKEFESYILLLLNVMLWQVKVLLN